jgi:fluoride ion exporter CrcB/FEX
MKPLDLISTLVAAVVGAALLGVLAYLFLDEESLSPAIFLIGAGVGVGVQTAVRVTGVS